MAPAIPEGEVTISYFPCYQSHHILSLFLHESQANSNDNRDALSTHAPAIPIPNAGFSIVPPPRWPTLLKLYVSLHPTISFTLFFTLLFVSFLSILHVYLNSSLLFLIYERLLLFFLCLHPATFPFSLSLSHLSIPQRLYQAFHSLL